MSVPSCCREDWPVQYSDVYLYLYLWCQRSWFFNEKSTFVKFFVVFYKTSQNLQCSGGRKIYEFVNKLVQNRHQSLVKNVDYFGNVRRKNCLGNIKQTSIYLWIVQFVAVPTWSYGLYKEVSHLYIKMHIICQTPFTYMHIFCCPGHTWP